MGRGSSDSFRFTARGSRRRQKGDGPGRYLYGMATSVIASPSVATVFGLSIRCPYGGFCTMEVLNKTAQMSLAEKWEFARSLTAEERQAIVDGHEGCPRVAEAAKEAEARRGRLIDVDEWTAL